MENINDWEAKYVNCKYAECREYNTNELEIL